MLSSFVSPRTAAIAAATPSGTTRVERQPGAVLFADISGFTRLGEELAAAGRDGAELLSGAISSCFAALIDVVLAHGGDVLRFGGDALAVFFAGMPDTAGRTAAACALEMQRVMRAVGRVDVGRRVVRLRMSMGLEVGTVTFVARHGHEIDVVPLGPTVSAALRLESAASSGVIAIGPAVASVLGPKCCVVRDGVEVVRPGAFIDGSIDTSNAVRLAPPGARTARRLVGPALSRFVTDHGAEYRVAPIAFVARRGTDALAAPRRHRALGAAVDAVYDALDDAVRTFGITLLASDVMVDGWKLVLAAGVPDPQPDDDARLLAAVRSVVEATGNDARGGVHRGSVFLGAVGHPKRRTITVMGDAVNTAARLMGAAEPGRVVAGEDVLRRAPDSIAVEWCAPLHLKGKRHVVRAATITGTAVATPDAVFVRPPDFVGRAAQIASVRATIAAAHRDGRGRVVELVGEASMGVSGVLAAALDGMRPVWRIEGAPFEIDTAFGALREPLRWLVGASRNEALPRQWRRAVEQRAPDIRTALPTVAAVIDERSASAATVSQERAIADIVQFVARLAPTGLVIAIDDAQWLDSSSRAVVSGIAAAASQSGLVVVSTRRPEESGLGAADTRIDVEPLTTGDVRRLVRVLADGERLTDATLDAIVERAHGSPVLARELVRAARAGFDPASLPDAIEAIHVRALESLSAADRVLLADVAVVGMEAPWPLLAAVRAERAPLSDAAARRIAWVLDVDDHRVRFRDRLVRDVVYARIPAARRRAVHERVCEVLARRPSVATRSALVRHAAAAGRADHVWAHAVRAADDALRSGAPVEAAHLLRAALDAASTLDIDTERRAEVAARLAPLLDGRAATGDAERMYRLGLRLSVDWRRRADLAAGLALCLVRNGRNVPALRVITAAERELPTSGRGVGALRDRLELARADVWHRQGRNVQSMECARRVAASARRRNDDTLLALALLAQQVAALAIGDPSASEIGDAAVVAMRRAGMRSELGTALMNRAVGFDDAGDWQAARRDYTAAARELGRAGEPAVQAIVRLDRSTIDCELGALDDLPRVLRDVERELRVLGYPHPLPLAHGLAARVEARVGCAPHAPRVLQAEAEAMRALGNHGNALFLDTWAAEAMLLAGDHAPARRLLDRLQPEVEHLLAGSLLVVTVQRLRAAAQWQAGSRKRAQRTLDAALADAQRLGLEPEIWWCLQLRAMMAATADAPIDAAEQRELTRLGRRLGVVSVPRLLD